MDMLASYEGPTEAGRMEGDGVYTYEDGTRYEGRFKNGAFHGKGRLIFANGEFRGLWNHGRQVEGRYVFKDGLEYEAEDWDYVTSKDRRFHSEKSGQATTEE
jgi:hypothetical protein